MRHAPVAGLIAALLSTPCLAAAQSATFVVLPFENTGSYGQDKEVFEALELGLAALVAAAIDRSPTADVAQGSSDAAMKRLNLGPRQRIDADGAAQVGKAAGARYAVTGSFADFYGKFRINARLVDARSGEIVKVVSNDDAKLQDRAQLALIIQRVAERITSAAGLQPSSPGAAPRIPTEAITAFSRGLLHESQGDRARAGEFYQQALTAAPGFAEAAAGLARVRGG